MRIQKLEVKGFRSLRDVTWEPGDLNVLIGPNASGKSNVLKLLDFIAAAARGELARYVQRAGGMVPLVWDGEGETIEIRCGGQVRIKSREGYQWLDRVWELGLAKDQSFYRLEHERVAASGKMLLERDRTSGEVAGSQVDLRKRDETLLSTRPEIENGLLALLADSLGGWGVFQDFRTDPKAELRQAAVSRHDPVLEGNGGNLASVLHTHYTSDRRFEELIDDAMSAALEGYEKLVFQPDADQRIRLAVRWQGLDRAQPAASLSDGTLHFLFLLTALQAPNLPLVLAIDEPETGLHPRMMPIIAELAVDVAEHSQVILTTHSEAMLDAFQDTIPTVASVESHAGATRIRPLPDEELRSWLREFSLGTIYRTRELEEIRG